MKRLISPLKRFASVFVVSTLLLGVSGCASLDPDRTRPSTVAEDEPLGFLVYTNYQGWENSILVSNGRVEAIIVPQIGRVMQFRVAGHSTGPFWENEELFGYPPDPTSTNWVNFGGDKAWPAPQGDWEYHTPREWPPPAGFDGAPFQATVEGWKVTLLSPVDPHYGIRVRREINLALDTPVMTITTTFEKVEGRPLMASVWVVTQLKDPVVVSAAVARPSMFTEGFRLQSEESPPSLRVQNGILSMTRDPKTAYKIGMDVPTLVWVGEETVLRIDSPRLPHQEYPHRGVSAEIYTNPNPHAYVELEMLGPLSKMIVGDTISRTSSYTLLPRIEYDPTFEVRRLLKR
jgi:hypothetical protein